MPLESQKISVYGISIGMYITKLDKPWADTSYPIEGFYLKESDEIRKLKLICRHVYIDIEKSRSSNGSKLKQTAKKVFKKELLIPNKIHYENVIPFKKVLKKAIKNHQQLQHCVNYLFSHFEKSSLNNVEQVRETVSSTVKNMIDNPDALMWVARTRENDDYTYNFILKQTIWSIATARQLGMNKADMERLALASILSGIGKSRLPKEILSKENKLNAAQFKVYQKHVNFTVSILKTMKKIKPQVVHIVQNHCEYIDGSGYPNKIRGSEIYVASQIIGLAAFYELNSSPRDNSVAISPNETLEVINMNKGKKFNSNLVEAFIRAIGIYPTGTLVQIDNGEIAVIVETQEKKHTKLRLRPDIIILRDIMDNKVSQHKLIELSSDDNTLKITQSLSIGSYGIQLSEINSAIRKSNNLWSLKRVIGF